MDATDIDTIRDLLEKDRFPSLAARWRRSVGGSIAANDHHVGLAPLFQNSRQRAHEYMIAAQRLEIARHERHDLVGRRKRRTGRQLERCIRRRLRRIGVNAFMDHIDPVAYVSRKPGTLPFGRRNALVASAKANKVAAFFRYRATWPSSPLSGNSGSIRNPRLSRHRSARNTGADAPREKSSSEATSRPNLDGP